MNGAIRSLLSLLLGVLSTAFSLTSLPALHPPPTQMNALIDTMQKETCPAGQWLMQEGEPGDTMYVIKTGKLEVFVGGKLTRHIGRGGAVGELALLYHTPRSASVKVRQSVGAWTSSKFCWKER